MSAATTVRVRVRPERAITLKFGEGEGTHTVLHVAGAEFELEPADAKTLADQGFVEPAPSGKTVAASSERNAGEGDDDLH